MTMEPNKPDFVRDDTGDVGGAPDRPEFGTQTIPDDAAVGEPGPDDTATKQAAKGFLALLMQVFTPQPTGFDKNGHPINPDLLTTNPELGQAGKEQLDLMRDALRYVAATVPGVNARAARWVTFPRHSIGANATRIAGYQANRRRLYIVNNGTDSVYLGETADVSDETGFVLTNGETVELFTQDEVWAVCASGESATVHMVNELYD